MLNLLPTKEVSKKTLTLVGEVVGFYFNIEHTIIILVRIITLLMVMIQTTGEVVNL
jgi:hypothetical protein